MSFAEEFNALVKKFMYDENDNFNHFNEDEALSKMEEEDKVLWEHGDEIVTICDMIIFKDFSIVMNRNYDSEEMEYVYDILSPEKGKEFLDEMLKKSIEHISTNMHSMVEYARIHNLRNYEGDKDPEEGLNIFYHKKKN